MSRKTDKAIKQEVKSLREIKPRVYQPENVIMAALDAVRWMMGENDVDAPSFGWRELAKG